jgi:hypothetical protein
MPIPRRNFLKYTGAAAAAATLPLSLIHADELIAPPLPPESIQEQAPHGAVEAKPVPAIQPAPQPAIEHLQKLHADYQSNNDGVEYFFLGNGSITAAVQTSQSADAGTHCGILLMSPEHFGRKASTFLYHPERGLQASLFNVVVNGTGSTPHSALAASDINGSPYSHVSNVQWMYPNDIPTVAIDWQAGPCMVHEELSCPISEPALIRTVTIKNDSKTAVKVMGFISLYPNLMLFDEYAVDRTRMTLTAKGFAEMRLFSPDTTRAGDRHLYFDLGDMAAGASRSVTVILTLNRTREEFERKTLKALNEETHAYWASAAALKTNDDAYNHLFHASQSSLRAAVAHSGKMDGGIWQYNLEWVRDQSMVAAASSMMGRTDIAESLLRRIMTLSIDEKGGTVDASRTRPPETMELDQNGELLYSLWVHWMWSGSDALIKEYWEKIQRLADYVLRPEFRDPAIGLVKNSREYWERDAGFGVNDGYELTYQMWNILGLAKAAEMAGLMHEPAKAQTWSDASALMKTSFLSHPRYSLVYEQRFIKRRNADGTPQFTFEPKNRKSMPPGMPLNVEKISYCDPDSASVLPIVYGIVDAHGEIASNTLQSMEILWNQRWTTGGYGRYHVTSEPDSPGAWPFPTMFIARAALEAGDDETVVRALSWLRTIKGGTAGTWLEFYGERPVPPLPPVGVVVWDWAEIVMFFMHNMIGIRPERDHLVIRPKLFKGVDTVDARIPVRGTAIDLKVRRAHDGGAYALVNGTRTVLTEGALSLPYPGTECAIEIYV